MWPKKIVHCMMVWLQVRHPCQWLTQMARSGHHSKPCSSLAASANVHKKDADCG